MRLGLTGGYCAGKNAVAALLAARGWDCIDVDALGHEAMELARGEIVARFGPGVLAADGSLDRRALARVVFADPRALADQEAIVHPVAIRLLERRAGAAEAAARAAGREALVCVNAALLHRVPGLAGCGDVVEVVAPLALRFARALARDRAGPLAAARRLWRQRGFRAALRGEIRASGAALHALRNDGSLDALARRLDAALSRIARDAGAEAAARKTGAAQTGAAPGKDTP